MTNPNDFVKTLPLGKPTTYPNSYDPEQLFPVPRDMGRESFQAPTPLPFQGADIWNAHEISWLNPQGKPQIATGVFVFDCLAPNLIESKSFKLYLNSFNNSKFAAMAEVQDQMQQDLSRVSGGNMSITLTPAAEFPGGQLLPHLEGTSIDDCDVECQHYQPHAEDLSSDGPVIEETLCSDLLMSLCLATGQPDWASVQIHYCGPAIERSGLLRYLISYRQHQAFHEVCVEQIFCDIWQQCGPEQLTVSARYTRRGGLDINPYRSSETIAVPENVRLWRC